MTPRFNQEKLKQILNFFQQAEKLKSIIRFSERKSIVRESSAAHSWRLALMVFVVRDELKLNINIEKALKIAIIHDLAESVTGDVDYILIADGKVSKKEKKKLEEDALQKIKNNLPKKIGKEIYNLWSEFEKGTTKEAKFVRALDRIETLTHLLKVGYKAYDRPELIPTYADKAVKNFPELTGMLKAIKQKLKTEFNKGKIPWKKEYENNIQSHL